MQKLFAIIIISLTSVSQSFAVLGGYRENNPSTKSAPVEEELGFIDSAYELFYSALTWLAYIIIGYFLFIIFLKSIRLFFEIYYSKNLRYLRVTLPRADSKLDKEKETKKDFKEKIGMMSMFYKAIHKLAEA